MKRLAIPIFCFCCASAAWAQTSTGGSIRGIVTDEQGAVLPGVVLAATSPDVPGTFTALSDATGYYRLLDLAPGNYSVVAELQGFAKFARENIAVRAGLNLGVNIVMKVGGVNEIIAVTVDTPMLESRSAVRAVNVNGDLQRSLPLSSRRNVFDFMELVPGTVTVGLSDPHPRNATVYINGANYTSFTIQLDGADIAAGAQSSLVYTSISSDVIEDVQIKTGGMDPSVPLGSAAGISIVTKSGTNQMRGSLGIVGQARSWSANNNPTGTTSSFSMVQPEGTVGGPVLRDHSWFLGSYRHSEIMQGVSRSGSQVDILEALSAQWQPLDRRTKNRQVFLKSTTQLAAHHRLDAFYQYGNDRTERIDALSGGLYSVAPIGGASAGARLSSTYGQSTTVTVGAAYNNQTNELDLLSTELPARMIYQRTSLSGGRRSGVTLLGYFDNAVNGTGQRQPQNKLVLTVDAERYRHGWAGTHTFKFGTYLNPVRTGDRRLYYPGGGYAVLEQVLVNPNAPAEGVLPFHKRIYDVTEVSTVKSTMHDYGVYGQDEWKPIDRLTLSGGVRVDWIRGKDITFDVLTQRTTAVGPRVGVNYRLGDRITQSLHASWVRVHDAASNGFRTTVGTNNASFRDEYDLNLDGSFETVFVTPAVTQLTLNRSIDLEGMRQPHVDEALVGYQLQLPGRVVLNTSFMHRTFRDQPALIETNGIYTNGVFRGYHDVTQNEIRTMTRNTWNWPVYNAIQVGFLKNGSRFQAMANYTRQFQHMAGTWQPNDPASFVQPEAFPTNRSVDSPSVTSPTSGFAVNTNLEQWRDHLLRGSVTVTLPWGIQLAAAGLYQSGYWSGAILEQLSAADPAFGSPTVTLSNGRVVSNPLSTLLRFAYGTRGEGQFRSDALTELNLRAARETRMGRTTLVVGLDVLNILNSGADRLLANGANQLFSTNFGPDQPGVNKQAPRMFQVSLRATF